MSTKSTVSVLAAALICAVGARAESNAAPAPGGPTTQPDAATNTTMIEVEVRFLKEACQDDLEKMGLGGWQLSPPPSGASTNAAATAAQPARERVTIARTNVPGFKMVGTNTPAPAFPASSAVLGPEQNALMTHALEQKAGMNLLSAPKITTRSGEKAEIKVVRELIYPANYQVEMLVREKKTGTLRRAAPDETVTPPDTLVTAIGIPEFAMRELGVILDVTPTLESDGQTIVLDIRAEVSELVEWLDYGIAQQLVDGDMAPIQMRQPVFHSRNIISNISIKDGATAIMGGLATADRQERLEKRPFWGSIPLLGRLFQHKTTEIVNKHMLILVTARIVKQ